MAVSPVMVPSEADKERYKSFTTMIQRERELMDKKKKLEDEVKWLEQTLSLLILSPSSNNLPTQAVMTAIRGRKENITAVVSMLTCMRVG